MPGRIVHRTTDVESSNTLTPPSIWKGNSWSPRAARPCTAVTLFGSAAAMSRIASAGVFRSMIMPAGMIMDRNTPAEAMRDMAAADPNKVTAVHGLAARGDQELPFQMDGGVKVFELSTSVVRWTILPGITVDAYAYNGQIPGPRIHLREGDRVRIHVRNGLPEETTVHWHGLILPNQMDGP